MKSVIGRILCLHLDCGCVNPCGGLEFQVSWIKKLKRTFLYPICFRTGSSIHNAKVAEVKLKPLLLLAVAMGCGLVAMLGVQQVLTGDGEGDEEVVQVLFATVEIPPGTRLTEDNVAFRDWPKSTVPKGAITKPEQYEDRAVRVRAVVDDLILVAKLGGKGDFNASNDIPKGMRVVAVPVDETMTAANMIRPGDRVDVMVTFETRDRRGKKTEIKTVLEYVKVFATNNVRDTGGTDAKEVKTTNISLLVTPEEAKTVKLADSQGELHLMLCPKGDAPTESNVDFKPYDTPEVVNPIVREDDSQPNAKDDDVDDFLNKNAETKTAKAEPVKEPEKSKWPIEIFEGDQRRVEEVDLTGDKAVTLPVSASAKPAWAGVLRNFFTRP